MDMIFISVFLGTFGLLVGIYAVWQSYRAAADRVQMREDVRNTRPRASAGRFIGGHDRLGE